MDVREMARLGGLARKKALSPEQRRKAAQKAARAKNRQLTKQERQEAARKAARARWERQKPLPQSADH